MGITMNQLKALSITALGLTAFSAHASWYYDENTFLRALKPDYYNEQLTTFDFGTPLNGQASYTAPGANGYGWNTIVRGGLFSLKNALSTYSDADQLELDFTGKTVTAFGAKMSNTFFGDPISGQISMDLNNGQLASKLVSGSGTYSFLGWVGNDPISNVLINADDYPAIKDITTGQSAAPVPEPASMLAIGGGILAMIRRKRK